MAGLFFKEEVRATFSSPAVSSCIIDTQYNQVCCIEANDCFALVVASYLFELYDMSVSSISWICYLIVEIFSQPAVKARAIIGK